MKTFGVSLLAGGAMLAAFVPGASAQNTTAAPPAPAPSPPPASSPNLNSPQLRDFSLQPRQRIVTQPVPIQTQPPTVSAPAPTTTQPRATQPRPTPAPAQPARSTPAAPRPAAPSPTAAQPTQAPPATQTAPAPAPAETAPAPEQPKAPPEQVPVNEVGGGFPWYYGIPLALLALLILAYVRQRRRARQIVEATALAAEERAAKAVETARPEPQPRPWLELELKAERLSSTNAESLVQFELEITNSGAAPARNLRIDVKMFNAGEQQDKEIGAFFRTAGRESTKCNLPGIRAGQTGAIRGEVAMPRADMRAVVLDNRYLFIPVIAVNALYDYGDGQTGQTSKSYVVGRELEQAGEDRSEKMGAFRVDQGPRIWRSLGQRQHKLARRV
ncbi:MAG TPA: hypothetical protein VMG08_14205 [Allosphingosinicella sp.]|nr:hypothetical protein [Allosphingosinicella sp.]